MANGFEPSLFDKLFEDLPLGAARRRLNLEQLIDGVARDLEALLNTRIVVDDVTHRDFPLAGRSVIGFGLADFAGMNLISVHDRRRICSSIEAAINAYEPRLKDVRVDLEPEHKAVNALLFSIRAMLIVSLAEERVAFDATLQPACLQYSVSQRAMRAGA